MKKYKQHSIIFQNQQVLYSSFTTATLMLSFLKAGRVTLYGLQSHLMLGKKFVFLIAYNSYKQMFIYQQLFSLFTKIKEMKIFSLSHFREAASSYNVKNFLSVNVKDQLYL